MTLYRCTSRQRECFFTRACQSRHSQPNAKPPSILSSRPSVMQASSKSCRFTTDETGRLGSSLAALRTHEKKQSNTDRIKANFDGKTERSPFRTAKAESKLVG